MSTTIIAAFIALSFATNSQAEHLQSESSCPATIGSDERYVEAWPESSSWYGSKALATIRAGSGVWPTTKPGAGVSVKIQLWSDGFEPGMESNLSITIKNLDGGQLNARSYRPTNAFPDSAGVPVMLVVFDFPDPGCWQITANYLGHQLDIVLETIHFEDFRKKYYQGGQSQAASGR